VTRPDEWREQLPVLDLLLAGPGRHRRRVQPSRWAAPVVTIGAVGAVTATSLGNGVSGPPRTVADSVGYQLPGTFVASPYVVPLDLEAVIGPGRSRVPPATTLTPRQLPPLPDVAPTSIPRPALAAYVSAADAVDKTMPECNLYWQLLAGIGYVESDHASSGGSASPSWSGEAVPPILGPVLDGQGGVAAIPDTDHGRLDGNTTWDRAVGPMQFLPSTWARFGADAGHDGDAPDPQNIQDAALAAAVYLCTAASRLDQPANAIEAVYSYNHSFDYVRSVLTITADYMRINPALLGVNGIPRDPVSPSPSPTPVPTASATRAPATPSPTRPTPSSPSPSPTPSASPTESASPSISPTLGNPTSSPTANPVDPSPVGVSSS
jgi:hypothetical protein